MYKLLTHVNVRSKPRSGPREPDAGFRRESRHPRHHATHRARARAARPSRSPMGHPVSAPRPRARPAPRASPQGPSPARGRCRYLHAQPSPRADDARAVRRAGHANTTNIVSQLRSRPRPPAQCGHAIAPPRRERRATHRPTLPAQMHLESPRRATRRRRARRAPQRHGHHAPTTRAGPRSADPRPAP